MPSTKWKRLEPEIPSEVQEVSTAIAASLDAVKQGLDAARQVIQVLQTAVQTDLSPAVVLANQALNLAINTIQRLINSFLDDTGAYVLLVPLPKKGLVSVVAKPDTPSEPGSNYVGFPDSAMLGSLSENGATEVRSSPSFSAIFDPGNTSLGGNAYIVQTLAASIYDAGDRNRPKFAGENYWAYGMVVAGAPDITSILSSIALLDRVFSPTKSANALPASRGVLDIVAAQVQAGPSGRGRMPVIEWARVPSSSTLNSYDFSTVVAHRYAIIRTTDFRTKTAISVLDLFPTADITEGMTGPGGAKVLKVADYDGVLNRYVDTETLVDGTTYYYFVAFKPRVINSMLGPDSGNGAPRSPGANPNEPTPAYTDLPFGLVSSPAEWQHSTSNPRISSTRLSRAPDWYRVPSVAGVFPGVERLLDIVNEVLESFRQSALSVSERTSQYLNQIAAIGTQLQRRIDDVQLAVGRINSLATQSNLGAYVAASTGQGPAGSFVADVVRLIDDASDPNRPPFDVGDEYVVAAVVLVVSPDASAVNTAKELLDLFLGLVERDSAVVSGIESVSSTLAQVEQSLINEITGGGTATASNPVAFDESMQPRPLGQPDARC